MDTEPGAGKPPVFPAWPFALALVALIALGTAFGGVARMTRETQEDSLDRVVNEWVDGHRDQYPAVTWAARAVTRLGNPWGAYPLIGLMGVVLLAMHREGIGKVGRHEATFWLLVTLGGQFLNLVLKTIFRRPRPPELLRLVVETSYSFPSGHSVFAAVFFSMLAVVLWRSCPRLAAGWRALMAVACGLLGLLIAGSRVWLAVHWPTDGIGGMVLGLNWVLACWLIRMSWAHWMRRRRPVGAA